jgi:endonuclease/exonuclease/phosphatase (EEP) superfamily protein YafD
LEQAEFIADDAAKLGEPMVIGGDFNTLEGDSVDATAEIFTGRGYTWATKHVTDTVSSAVGSFTLDHIYVKGLDALSAHTRSTEASDHQPVWVLLERRDDP